MVKNGAEHVLRVDKRNKFQIYYDILEALRLESSTCSKFSLARVARDANLPYNRFQKTLSLLMSLELVKKDGCNFVVTEKGNEYLSEYHKIKEFFKRMGFS